MVPFQVFVKGLSGRTTVLSGCCGSIIVDDFMEQVAMRMGIPETCFHLVWSGSRPLFMGSTLGNMEVQRDSSLHGWASSLRSFASEASSGPGLLDSPHVHNFQPEQGGRPRPPRENQFLERSHQATGGGNPTYRKPGPQVPPVARVAMRTLPLKEMLWR